MVGYTSFIYMLNNGDATTSTVEKMHPANWSPILMLLLGFTLICFVLGVILYKRRDSRKPRREYLEEKREEIAARGEGKPARGSSKRKEKSQILTKEGFLGELGKVSENVNSINVDYDNQVRKAIYNQFVQCEEIFGIPDISDYIKEIFKTEESYPYDILLEDKIGGMVLTQRFYYRWAKQSMLTHAQKPTDFLELSEEIEETADGFPADWEERVKTVMERESFKCAVCGERLKPPAFGDVYHITPKIKGGNDKLTNLVLLCGACFDVIDEEHWESRWDSEEEFKIQKRRRTAPIKRHLIEEHSLPDDVVESFKEVLPKSLCLYRLKKMPKDGVIKSDILECMDEDGDWVDVGE